MKSSYAISRSLSNGRLSWQRANNVFGKFEFIYSTKKIFWLFFGLYDKYDLSSLKSNTCHIIRQCGSDPLTKILRSQHHFGCIKYSLDLKIVGILEIRKRCRAGGHLPTWAHWWSWSLRLSTYARWSFVTNSLSVLMRYSRACKWICAIQMKIE